MAYLKGNLTHTGSWTQINCCNVDSRGHVILQKIVVGIFPHFTVAMMTSSNKSSILHLAHKDYIVVHSIFILGFSLYTWKLYVYPIRNLNSWS
uniref:Uncharacterized protein n=1 Tax=Arundo donax TaxID=35708 RepID=A0A0A8YCW6_ARUDO